MNVSNLLSLAGMLGGLATVIQLTPTPSPSAPVRVHVQNEFEFTVRASYENVAPLFGALREKVWAGSHWNPSFIYPQPAADIDGGVFIIDHGHTAATWVNTAFDLKSGFVQYVYVIPGMQAVRIDIHLARQKGPVATHVRVIYQRTGSDSEFNARVTEQGENDRRSGAEWASAIEDFLQSESRHVPPTKGGG